MHLTDIDKGLIGAFGIVGGGLPVSVGAGVTAQLNGRGQLSATFSATAPPISAPSTKSMNIAQVWKLPVLFICENNLYGEFTRINHSTPYEDLIKRAKGYDMPAVQVDGNDVEAVYEATAEAANRARSGGGPTFIECMTYRHRGHSRTDPAKYRDPKEVEAWLARDPLKLYEAALVKRKLLTRAKAEKIIVDERAAAARRLRARRRPRPGPVAGDRLPSPNLRLRTAMQEITYREAILAALQEEMRRDDKILIMGEDIGPSGGPFKTCQGLYEEFGAARVRDTPIAETGFVGAALGLAITGYRPIAEIMFADFLGVCFDQIVNSIAKHRFMSGGKVKAPLVIRAIGGAGPALRRAALADRRVLAPLGARPHHRLPVLAERGLWHAPRRDPLRQPGGGIRAQGAACRPRARSISAGRCRRSPGRRCSAPAATRPSSRALPWSAARSRRRSCSPRTGSRRRSSISARSAR